MYAAYCSFVVAECAICKFSSRIEDSKETARAIYLRITTTTTTETTISVYRTITSGTTSTRQ